MIRHAACYLVLGAFVAMRGGLGNAAEPGVTADEILLGTHAPLSGPAARFGAVPISLNHEDPVAVVGESTAGRGCDAVLEAV